MQEEAHEWAVPAKHAGVAPEAAQPRSAGAKASSKRKAAALGEVEAEALLDERARAWSQAHQFAA